MTLLGILYTDKKKSKKTKLPKLKCPQDLTGVGFKSFDICSEVYNVCITRSYLDNCLKCKYYPNEVQKTVNERLEIIHEERIRKKPYGN